MHGVHVPAVSVSLSPPRLRDSLTRRSRVRQALAAPEVAAEEAPPEEHALVGEWAQRDWRQAFCTLVRPMCPS